MSNFAQVAVDATYRMRGLSAVYQPPGGASVACRVLPVNPDATVGFDSARAVTAQTVMRVRATEVTPVKGGRFVIGTATIEIHAAPQARDPRRLEWECQCRSV